MTMDWQAVHDMERDVSENKEMYQALADGTYQLRKRPRTAV